MHVNLASGKSTKDWPFTHCSESPFSEGEFERYKKQLAVDGMSLPTKSELSKQCEIISNLIDHRFTEAQVNEKLEKQNKFRHLLQAAEPSLVKNRSMDQQQKLRIRNELNRKQNSEDVRRALVTEKNRQRAAARRRQAEAAKLEAEKSKDSLAVPKNDIDGLFSEGSDISRAATPVQGRPVVQQKKGGMPSFSKVCLDDDILATIDLGIDIDI
jgi:RNA polymerase-associated protein RTF1